MQLEELSFGITFFSTNIPYSDSTFFEIKIKISPFSENKAIFSIRSNQDNSVYLRNSNYYIIPNSEELVPAFSRNDVEFLETFRINNIDYKNINVLIDTSMYFDSIYYNSAYGFIRLANKNVSYNILN